MKEKEKEKAKTTQTQKQKQWDSSKKAVQHKSFETNMTSMEELQFVCWNKRRKKVIHPVMGWLSEFLKGA